MKNKPAALFLMVMAALVLIPSMTHASSGGNVTFTSTNSGYTNTTLLIPLNSHGSNALPDWDFAFSGNVSYSIFINSVLLTKGFSSSGTNVQYTAHPGEYNVSIMVNGQNYTETDITVIGVSVSAVLFSTLPGQAQTLSVYANQTGQLVYPHWSFWLYSSAPSSFNVLADGHEIKNGTFSGLIKVNTTVNGTLGTGQVFIGNHVFNFKNEPITSVPLSKHFSPPAPPLLYTQGFFNLFQIKTIIAAMLSLMVSVLLVYPLMKHRSDNQITRG